METISAGLRHSSTSVTKRHYAQPSLTTHGKAVEKIWKEWEITAVGTSFVPFLTGKGLNQLKKNGGEGGIRTHVPRY
jgi:hypothetical protein